MTNKEPREITITKSAKITTYDGKKEDYHEVITCPVGLSECTIEVTQNNEKQIKNIPRSQIFPNSETK